MISGEINRAVSETKGFDFATTRSEDMPDWLTDEAASAKLLEEMPEPTLMKDLGQWMCDPDGTSNPDLCRFAKDRKTAIALAWLRWKGVEVQP